MYYSRKLTTYNLSVFDLVSKEAKCFMWCETLGKRGSNEIASCLFNYNNAIGPVEHLSYYSDSCTGRNLHCSSMCLYSVVNLPIETITHNYFERGHSQMEGDSVHATIEKFIKKRDMYAPCDYFSAVRNSKVSDPKYVVKEMEQHDFLNFKQLSSDTIINRNIDTDLSKVKWNKIHMFQYRKVEPRKVYFKYNYNDDWRAFEICKTTRKAAKFQPIEGFTLEQLYDRPIPISNEKYADLIKLCQSSIIPPVHHTYYRALLHGKSSGRLPEHDESEDSV